MNGNEFEKLEHEVEVMLNDNDSDLDLEKIEKLFDAYANNFKAAKEYLQSLPEVKLQQFFNARGINAKVVATVSGPRITRYEIETGIGVSPKKIKKLQDEIQMQLASPVKILAPIPGRAEVGIEVPNENPQTVMLNDIFESSRWKNSSAAIPLAIGKNVAGEPVVCDLYRLQHILIAGESGTGKSTCINSIIASLVKNFSPKKLQFIMCDPTIVELDKFSGLPHLRMPVVNDVDSFAEILRRTAYEMDDRYRKIFPNKKSPRIVIVINELNDLMQSEKKLDFDVNICRIAQDGSEVGVHLIVVTNEPEKSITGTIKCNIPTKFCFQVRNSRASKIVLDKPGAEELLGKGDMLMSCELFAERVQGAWISNEDIDKIIKGDRR